jgi:hypothetical protein
MITADSFSERLLGIKTEVENQILNLLIGFGAINNNHSDLSKIVYRRLSTRIPVEAQFIIDDETKSTILEESHSNKISDPGIISEIINDVAAKINTYIDFETDRAIVQEICVKILQGWLSDIRSKKVEIVGEWDQWNDIRTMYSASPATCHIEINSGFEKAVEKFGDTWAIISPTVLTILQTHGFTPLPPPHTGFGLVYMGQHLGVDLYVDTYAHDDTPILLGTSGAFQVSNFNAISAVQEATDPNTFEEILGIISSYSFKIIDESKFLKISINPATLGCFL